MFLLLTKKNNDIFSTLHPATVVVFFCVMLTMVMVLTHPLYLTVLLMLAAWGIFHEDGWDAWRPILLLGLWITLFIVVINVFFSRNGSTIIWEGPRVWFLGKIFFTKEALLFALDMGLKLIATFALSVYFGLCLSFDRVFSLFYRLTPRSAQVLILSVIMFPKMIRRCRDVYDVMRLRGAPMQTGTLTARLNAHMPLLKVLLLSGLEDSWQMGETLYARGYASGQQRTYFTRLFVGRMDVFVWILSAVMTAVGVQSLFEGHGLMPFYPSINATIGSADILCLAVMIVGFLIFIYLNPIWKKWTFLR